MPADVKILWSFISNILSWKENSGDGSQGRQWI